MTCLRGTREADCVLGSWSRVVQRLEGQSANGGGRTEQALEGGDGVEGVLAQCLLCPLHLLYARREAGYTTTGTQGRVGEGNAQPGMREIEEDCIRATLQLLREACSRDVAAAACHQSRCQSMTLQLFPRLLHARLVEVEGVHVSMRVYRPRQRVRQGPAARP